MLVSLNCDSFSLLLRRNLLMLLLLRLLLRLGRLLKLR